MKMDNATVENSSFRDSSGMIFYRNDKVFRQINNSLHAQYDHLMSSGLYDSLQSKSMIVAYMEVDERPYFKLFYKVISLLSSLANYIIVEFVPKEDEQVTKLLKTREDVFQEYSQIGFEKTFSTYFDKQDSECIEFSQRTIYLHQRR